MWPYVQAVANPVSSAHLHMPAAFSQRSVGRMTTPTRNVLADGDVVVAVVIEPGRLAWREDDDGEGFLDERRPGDHGARTEHRAFVQGRVDERSPEERGTGAADGRG